MTEYKYFMLFANCIPVLGKTESVIMDLQREEYFTISNLICEILLVNSKSLQTINKIKELYNNQYDKGIDSYFDYLVSEELGFYTNEPKLYPKIDLEFLVPFKLLTGIIEFDTNISDYNLESLISQYSKLGCQSLQLRIFNRIDLLYLKKSLENTIYDRTKVIEIYLEDFNYDTDILFEILRTNLKIRFFIHSHLKNIILPDKNKNFKLNIFYFSQKIKKNSLEIINETKFTINTFFYVESVNFNVGLNRKICVDSHGNIKNYLNHSKIYGNINNTNINTILEMERFKYKWHISNDRIEKCRNCQYRYMCLSNSDIELVNGKYYKVDYCNLHI